jgi:hypothetical protein
MSETLTMRLQIGTKYKETQRKITKVIKDLPREEGIKSVEIIGNSDFFYRVILEERADPQTILNMLTSNYSLIQDTHTTV